MRANEFRMLSQSKCFDLPGRSDSVAWTAMVEAMNVLAISAAEQSQLCSLLAALLLLGNVAFEENDDEKAEYADATLPQLRAAEELLACGKLSANLTSKKISRGTRGSVVQVGVLVESRWGYHRLRRASTRQHARHPESPSSNAT